MKFFKLLRNYFASLWPQMFLFIFMNFLVGAIEFKDNLRFYYLFASVLFTVHSVLFFYNSKNKF